MENIGRKKLIEMLEKLREKEDWARANVTRDILEELLMLLIDGAE